MKTISTKFRNGSLSYTHCLGEAYDEFERVLLNPVTGLILDKGLFLWEL